MSILRALPLVVGCFAWGMAQAAPVFEDLQSEPTAKRSEGQASKTITVSTNFESGSAGQIEYLGPDDLRVHVLGQANASGRNRQATWYYFRLDGVRGRNITVHLTDLVGEYNFTPGACAMNADTIPVFSEDGERWQHFQAMDWDDTRKEATLHLAGQLDTVWVAHTPPYPLSRLEGLLAALPRSPSVRVEIIGKSVLGRPLNLVTVTDPDVAPTLKKCVWLIARQHAWETGTSFVLEGALRFLISDEGQARQLRQRVIFRLVPTMDPDGLALGHVRFNSLGYDLNRHWPEVDAHRNDPPPRFPEIWSVKRALFAQLDRHQPIDFLLNLHNTELTEFLETQADDPTTQAKLNHLHRALSQKTSFDPSREPVINATPPDTTNSLWPERHVPAVLMEQRISASRKLGRRLTVADRLEFGRRLAVELAEAALLEIETKP